MPKTIQRDRASDLARRIRAARLAAGHTIADAARQTGVATLTWSRWELSRHTPRPWTLADAALTLGVPVASLLTDRLILAEVSVSDETLERVRREGAPAARAAAVRIAAQLEALLLAKASAPPVDVSPGARPKRRRTRAEVLAGTRAANAARKRRDEGHGRIE